MEYRLLGSLEVLDASGHKLPLGGAMQQSVLASLLLRAERTVALERIVDELWEEPPASAERTVRVYVSRLRHQLPEGLIESRPGGYALLLNGDRLDLHTFEQTSEQGRAALANGDWERAQKLLRDALALWRGPALAGLPSDALRREAERLEELRLQVLEDRLEADLERGSHREVVAELQALVAEQPFRERLRVQLMLALYRAGRQTEALDAYQDARRILVDELGIEPSAPLRELEQAILRQDSSLAPPVPEGLRADFPQLRTGQRRRRIDRRLIPVVVVLLGGALTAGLLLTRGQAGSAQATVGVAADSVGAFQSRSGRLVAQKPVGTGPGSVAAGDGAVWVVNVDSKSVSRVDPKTNNVTQTVTVGSGPAGLAVGGGFVWLANSLDGTLSKIDPRSNGGTPVDVIPVGNQPTGVAYGLGSVWVANSSDRTVVRIDPRSDKPLGRAIQVDAGAEAIAVGDGAVWVTSGAGNSVARIVPRSRSVQAITVGNGPAAIAVGPGAVWVANSFDGTVSRIDPTTNEVKATIQVGEGPNGVAVSLDGRTVWISNELGGTLSRIDPARNSVVQTVETGNRPEGVAVTGDTMYVAVRTSGLARRGGTLNIYDSPHPYSPTIDPAITYATTSWQILVLTNDGLTGFKRVANSLGTRLVPDLATSLPTPTDGGRTYTFELRPGIRYSTGALVRPADFRRAIERSLANPDGPGASFFSGIVGAVACVKQPKRCSLSHGVVSNDASNAVTFHLVAPDPDLLYKLALPTAYAVPASTPLKEQQTVPATGPYMFASYDSMHGVRLVRNPHFHEWSAAAQPNGYPDKIVWTFHATGQDISKAAVRAVEHGTADFTNSLPTEPAQLAALRTQYASQLHVNPTLSVNYFFLNTRVRPFDDVKVRRAVNYAVDENRFVELQGGPYFAQPSCDVLPPNLVGYRRYCPYTIHPTPGGPYNGPDLAKAQQLVAASGTRGSAVTVWRGEGNQTWLRDASYLVSVLRSLGYTTRLKLIPAKTYFPTIADSRSRIQTAPGGWYADYPSPSDFIPAQLSCAQYQPASRSNHNVSAFCNRHIDTLISRAGTLQATDPHAAAALWAEIDHKIVDQAPWVMLPSTAAADFVSSRVGNYTYSPWVGALLDELWVR